MHRTLLISVVFFVLWTAAPIFGDAPATADSSAGPDSAAATGSGTDSAAVRSAGTGTAPSNAPPTETRQPGAVQPHGAWVFLVNGTTNIESLEADFTDEFDDEDEPTLQLEDSDSPSGLGFMISGGVVTILSALVTSGLIMERSISASPAGLDAGIIFGSSVNIYGVVSVVIGIHQLRHHIRMDNRYARPAWKRATPSGTKETAPVVIRKKQL